MRCPSRTTWACARSAAVELFDHWLPWCILRRGGTIEYGAFCFGKLDAGWESTLCVASNFKSQWAGRDRVLGRLTEIYCMPRCFPHGCLDVNLLRNISKTCSWRSLKIPPFLNPGLCVIRAMFSLVFFQHTLSIVTLAPDGRHVVTAHHRQFPFRGHALLPNSCSAEKFWPSLVPYSLAGF